MMDREREVRDEEISMEVTGHGTIVAHGRSRVERDFVHMQMSVTPHRTPGESC